MHVLCVKTRGVRYFNVEAWMWFDPYQNFWLRACPVRSIFQALAGR